MDYFVMSSLCPQLTQLYQTWSDSLTEVRDVRLRYQNSGSDEDKTAFDRVLLQAQQAQEDYRIENTPAAKDPKVQEKLKAFQEAHPGAQVI